MPSGWYRANTDRWEKGFAALAKFRARTGHCLPPSRHVEGKFKLGVWVRTQRYYKDRWSRGSDPRLLRLTLDKLPDHASGERPRGQARPLSQG
jgi:hypothetical protein